MGDGEGPDLSCFDFSSDRNQEAAEKSGKASDAGKTADLKQLLKSQRQEEQRLRTEAKEKKFAKSDRAARAAVDEELEASLAAMRERHAAEVAAAGGDPAGEAAGALSQLSVSGTGTGSGGGGSKKGGKTAKKGAKRDEDERQRESRMAHTKANAGPSLRELELRRLTDVLAPHRLRVYEIAADGHCLYRSLAHQLVDGGDETAVDFRYCRQLVLADTALASRAPLLCRARAAGYIRAHPDDFLPFLLAEHEFSDGLAGCVGGRAAETRPRLLESYCTQVESSSEWGGQLEITAIAHGSRRCVAVFSADAPLLLTGSEYECNGKRLQLAYHRHYYGLGEHYNSLVETE